MSEEYRVKSGEFEGPLDLLLTLIEKRKLHISDVSLAEITDDYLGYVQESGQVPMESAAHFIVVASTLVLIKSRSLLPTLTLTQEEEESIDELEARLKEYQLYKTLSRGVGERFGTRRLFRRTVKRAVKTEFSPTHEVAIPRIVEAINTILANLPKKELIPQIVVEKMVTLEEMTERLTKRITMALSMSFRDFAGGDKNAKADVVVSFLAMLELVRRGMITVRQDNNFDDIAMEAHEVATPRY